MKLKTRYEQIKSMSKEEMVKFLCEVTECGYCPASKYCYRNHTGFVDWLDEKAVNYENV